MSTHIFDVDALLGSIDVWRRGGTSLAALMIDAGVETVRDDELIVAVRERLLAHPELIDRWQHHSHDKRWSPSPYLDDREVGHYDAGAQNVRHHATNVDACADFVVSEVRWVVDRRVVVGEVNTLRPR